MSRAVRVIVKEGLNGLNRIARIDGNLSSDLFSKAASLYASEYVNSDMETQPWRSILLKPCGSSFYQISGVEKASGFRWEQALSL
jgi:hypothetical protein